MARKKKPDDGADHDAPHNGTSLHGTAVADPPSATTPPTETPPPVKNQPAASFAANSDRTTRIEVAVWSKLVKLSEQEEYTQYSLTLSRTWRDQDGNWRGNGSFRIHDVPVLLYLIQQAYHWCLAQRTQVHVEASGEVPF